MSRSSFWQGRRVLLTGQTGFKGAWLSLWLESLGAEVIGFSLPPPTHPNLFQLADVARGSNVVEGDLRDLEALSQAVTAHQPEIMFHLAAQALVRHSYGEPVDTFASNVQGTVHLLEAARRSESVRGVVVVTSDKCYENQEWSWGYRENDPMGGHDPYSASKGCAELVVSAYRRSFLAAQGIHVASARAGNVMGGGDWGESRLIPDAMRAFAARETLVLRNPAAIRPWQHVLEPLHGYLLLARRLIEEGEPFAQGWNFGPNPADSQTVGEVVDRLSKQWGGEAHWRVAQEAAHHEAMMLRLDSGLAQHQLGWQPTLSLDEAIAWSVAWYRAHAAGESDLRGLTLDQIARFEQRISGP